MNCKIDHSDPDAFPAFLCRTCCPALVPTDADRQEYAHRARAARERESIRQQLLRTEQKISSMSRDGEPDPCVVPIKAKVYGSLVRKAERLRGELQGCNV